MTLFTGVRGAHGVPAAPERDVPDVWQSQFCRCLPALDPAAPRQVDDGGELTRLELGAKVLVTGVGLVAPEGHGRDGESLARGTLGVFQARTESEQEPTEFE